MTPAQRSKRCPDGSKVAWNRARNELADIDGQVRRGTYIVVRPTVTWSWGLDGDDFESGRFAPTRREWS